MPATNDSERLLIGSIDPFALYTQDRMVASEATTLGLVRGVYSHAIEYTTRPKGERGMGFLYFGLGGALMGAIWVFFTGLILHDNYSKEQSGDWFVYLFFGPLFLLGVLFTILMPIIMSMELWPGPLDLPIMFDRRMRKVYKLIEQRDVSGRVKQRGRVGILEYDWEDVLASHRVSTVFIGNGASAQRNHSLWLLVRDKDAKGFEGAITPVNQPPYIDEIALPVGADRKLSHL